MAQPLPAISNVPPEVHNLFIDELRDDKASLVSCALVCRAWNPYSRRHLFHSICVIEKEHRNVAAFLKLLNSSADVHPHIHALTLRAWPPVPMDPIYWRCGTREASKPSIPLDLHVLATILSNLPNLQTLRLLEFAYTYAPEYGLPQTAFKIEELSVRQTPRQRECSFKTLGVLALFAEVDRLCLEDGSRHDCDPRNDFTRRPEHELLSMPKPRVHNLTFGWIQEMDYYWRYLLPSSSSSTLTGLGAVFKHSKDFGAFGTVLCKARHSIRSVELRITSSFIAKNLKAKCFGIDLSKCPSLESLVLGLNLVGENNPLWPVYTHLLRHAPHTLREIIVRVSVMWLYSTSKFFAALQSLDGAAMDKVLGVREELRAVKFEFTWDDREKNIPVHTAPHPDVDSYLVTACRDILQEMLPTIHARGLLRVR